jgi:uncharacterized Zn finger protein (UPF0148 family)
MDELTKCPKCKTRTLVRKGDKLVCSQCNGHFALSAPAVAARRDFLLSRHQFYEGNKDKILADYKRIGGKETAKKLGVTWPALYHILRRWKVIETQQESKKNGEERIGIRVVDPEIRASEIGRLPSFPEFSNHWDPQVQTMWFQIYGKLVDARKE